MTQETDFSNARRAKIEYENSVTLGNGVELTRAIVKNLMGKELSEEIGSTKLYTNVIYTIAANKFREIFAAQLGEQ